MKGTTSAGKRNKRNHTICKRCGNRSYHKAKHECASCGFPSLRIRHHNWAFKGQRRRTTGTGRMKHLRDVQRRFKNGFREGTTAPRIKFGKVRRLHLEEQKKKKASKESQPPKTQ